VKYLFIGGTADGKLIDVPEKIYRWRVPTSPIVTAIRDGTSFQDQATSYEDYRIEIFRTPDGDIKLFILDGMTPFSAMQGLIWRYTQIHRGACKPHEGLCPECWNTKDGKEADKAEGMNDKV
jgi:hypothetical protein